MKWKIENVGVHCNILEDDGLSNMDSAPVGLGFPEALATRLVEKHNASLVVNFNSKIKCFDSQGY